MFSIHWTTCSKYCCCISIEYVRLPSPPSWRKIWMMDLGICNLRSSSSVSAWNGLTTCCLNLNAHNLFQVFDARLDQNNVRCSAINPQLVILVCPTPGSHRGRRAAGSWGDARRWWDNGSKKWRWNESRASLVPPLAPSENGMDERGIELKWCVSE